MKSLFITACLFAIASPVLSFADDKPADSKDKDLTKATFLITGLHCPPCTRTVERSLANTKGVKSISVNWNNKNAKVEFDEKQVSAQAISKLIESTPHMMGGNLEYTGWLALKIPSLSDDQAGERVKEVVGKVPGVKKVVVYTAQKAIGVLFDREGTTTTQQLIEALEKAEIKASNL